MAIAKQKITPCLWFDTQAEDAANFYVASSRIPASTASAAFPTRAKRFTARKPGSVMVVEFEIEGQSFTALNGGPQFTFDEAVSFQVVCETQAEVDYYWSKLTPMVAPKARADG